MGVIGLLYPRSTLLPLFGIAVLVVDIHAFSISRWKQGLGDFQYRLTKPLLTKFRKVSSLHPMSFGGLPRQGHFLSDPVSSFSSSSGANPHRRDRSRCSYSTSANFLSSSSDIGTTTTTTASPQQSGGTTTTTSGDFQHDMDSLCRMMDQLEQEISKSILTDDGSGSGETIMDDNHSSAMDAAVDRWNDHMERRSHYSPSLRLYYQNARLSIPRLTQIEQELSDLEKQLDELEALNRQAGKTLTSPSSLSLEPPAAVGNASMSHSETVSKEPSSVVSVSPDTSTKPQAERKELKQEAATWMNSKPLTESLPEDVTPQKRSFFFADKHPGAIRNGEKGRGVPYEDQREEILRDLETLTLTSESISTTTNNEMIKPTPPESEKLLSSLNVNDDDREQQHPHSGDTEMMIRARQFLNGMNRQTKEHLLKQQQLKLAQHHETLSSSDDVTSNNSATSTEDAAVQDVVMAVSHLVANMSENSNHTTVSREMEAFLAKEWSDLRQVNGQDPRYISPSPSYPAQPPSIAPRNGHAASPPYFSTTAALSSPKTPSSSEITSLQAEPEMRTTMSLDIATEPVETNLELEPQTVPTATAVAVAERPKRKAAATTVVSPSAKVNERVSMASTLSRVRPSVDYNFLAPQQRKSTTAPTMMKSNGVYVLRRKTQTQQSLENSAPLKNVTPIKVQQQQRSSSPQPSSTTMSSSAVDGPEKLLKKQSGPAARTTRSIRDHIRKPFQGRMMTTTTDANASAKKPVREPYSIGVQAVKVERKENDANKKPEDKSVQQLNNNSRSQPQPQPILRRYLSSYQNVNE